MMTGMMVDGLEGWLLDYWVARAMGYRFWLEKRGGNELAVVQPPMHREPWLGTRSSEIDKKRYTEVFSAEDLKVGFFGNGINRFSTDWALGGPIIERERIDITAPRDGETMWGADIDSSTHPCGHEGPTPLIAAMRAYVTHKFGDSVTDGAFNTSNREKDHATP